MPARPTRHLRQHHRRLLVNPLVRLHRSIAVGWMVCWWRAGAGHHCLHSLLTHHALVPPATPQFHPTPPRPKLPRVCSPKGTFNNEEAQDNCNPCPPGQYSNTLGARECKVGTASVARLYVACLALPAVLAVALLYCAMQSRGVKPPEPHRTFLLPACLPACAHPSAALQVCPAGTYSAGQSSFCIPCRPGYFAPAGAGACSPW